jgi:tetratricopeptide (TPR) repeat protein
VLTVHPDEAVRTLEAMARDWPDDRVVLERLIDVEDSLLRVDETVAHLEKLAQLSPGDATVLRRLADQYRWKGQSEPLLQTLRKLAHCEDAVEERAELVDILLSNRRYDELIAWLSPDLDHAPAAVDLRLALYEAYLRTDRMDEATAQLRRVLELDPGRVELLRDVADYLVSRGLFDQAVQLYRDRIDRQPRDARRFALELDDLYEAHAEKLVATGNQAAAVALYRERIARAPLDVSLRLELAELYGARADQVAVTELQKLVEAAPNSVDAWIALGERYSWTDRLPQAIKAYRQAVRLAPENRAARRALAQNLLYIDRTDDAIAQYRELANGDEVDREALIDLLIEEERGADALAYAEKLSPTPRHQYLAALAAHAAGADEQALPALIDWTKKQGGDVRAWQALVECASALDEPDVAVDALRHVRALGGRRTR